MHHNKRGVWLRRGGVAALAATIFLLAVSWYAGGKLSAPAAGSIGAPPVSLAATSISFPSSSGSTIHGWLTRGSPGKGAVLLLHGVRGNRSDMVSRAEFLRALGYSALLIDLQAHGESPGDHITLGYLESLDVIAARDFLRHALPDEPVGVIGVSLGAAAVVLADGQAAFDAVVLESMYPTLEQAIANRLRLHLGEWGTVLAPLLILQLRPRLGIGADQLRPIDRIHAIGAPVLIIHGALDQHTLIGEARAQFAAAAEPKELWEIEGAAHVNLHRFAEEEYESRVGEFLGKYLVRQSERE